MRVEEGKRGKKVVWEARVLIAGGLWALVSTVQTVGLDLGVGCCQCCISTPQEGSMVSEGLLVGI